MATLRTVLVAAVVLLWSAVAGAVPVRVLVTGDMHGWIVPKQDGRYVLGGAAEMLARWKADEHYEPSAFLVLSCGDTATGPALSTIFKGEPAILVMNRMGYDASALGNHEFDFGLGQLARLEHDARFPFLAANLKTSDGKPARVATPFLLYEEQGVKIGVIGLITAEPGLIANLGSLKVVPYGPALREAAAAARAKGAKTIIVVAHVPQKELVQLARDVSDLGIPLMVGGHSHELAQVRVPETGTWVVNSGQFFQAYSRVDLEVDPESGRSFVTSARQVWVDQEHPDADPGVAEEVTRWRAKLDQAYSAPLGYAAQEIPASWPLYNLVAEAWLESSPGTDIALVNSSSLRQSLPAGVITMGDLVGMMPFDNRLLELRLPGHELEKFVRAKVKGTWGLAGLRVRHGSVVLAKTGRPLDPGAVYKILVTDYLYNSGRGLRNADASPRTVAADWREPVTAWFGRNATGDGRPLERLLDPRPRVEP